MQARARIDLRRSTIAKQTRRPLMQPSPIVKWAGGKSRLLAQLQQFQPMQFRRYFEPFVGGGAMFFSLAPDNAVLGDRNPDLINMYRCVAWNVEAVIKRLSRHRQKHDEEYYYNTRKRWNSSGPSASDVARAATFIYLNKTCYNGLWRVNSKGGFNVPIGRYESPKIYDTKFLRAASGALQRAELVEGGFEEAIESAGEGDFVYFDPPYHPLTPTASFTSYTAGDFSEDDQRRLAKVVADLTARGCAVMLSNSDTKFINKLYSKFTIHKVSAARAINSSAKKRGKITELVVTNKHCLAR